MQTVLITGLAGFVGSHLAEWFLKAGVRVLGIDDLSTGKLANINHLRSKYDGQIKLVVSSCAKRRVIENMVIDSDAVFHLAAVVGVKRVMENPVHTIEAMRDASGTVFQLCAEYQKRLIFTSTSEVYGANPAPEFREDMDCIIGPSTKARWCYAAAKLMDEFLALGMHRHLGLPITVVRLFNTIGPRQTGQYGMVVPTFIHQAREDKPCTVFGDGSQSRCFTWVGDVVDCIVRLAENDAAIGEVINIGSTEAWRIEDLALHIQRQVGRDPQCVYKSYAEVYGEDFADMPHRKPNVEKLRGLIGCVPETPLADSIRMILEHKTMTCCEKS